MNRVVARLTARSLLGRRRFLALLILPLLLIGLAVLVRTMVGTDDDLASAVVFVFGLGTLMPLIGLITGTGSIGPEIGDGSIIYILAKPIRRSSIILSKLAVAIGVAVAMGVLPIYISAWILTGSGGMDALAPTAGALTAAIAYCAMFQLLAVVTRNAVVIGLVYALVWESVVGQFIPGARALSVQQWSLAISDRMLADSYSTYVDLDPAVELRTGVIMLVLVTVISAVIATRKLWRVRLTFDE